METTPKEFHIYETEERAFENRLLSSDRKVRDGVGEDVKELRFPFGSGYRIYFGEEGNTLIILFCRGNKKDQSKDIKKAKQYWQDYLRK